MAVLFLDTDCELWYDKAEELGFEVIGMPYTLDGVEYFYDLGKNTDFAHFYKRMREGSVPSTSALNVEIYKEIFEPFFQRGEQMLYIAFSSKMSCTFESYEAAVKELSQKYPSANIVRFDTLSISMGAGLPVYMAGKYFASGKTIEQTIEYLNQINPLIDLRFIVDDMVYLKRGGRISASKAMLGTLMKIKPALTVNDEGKLDVCAKLNGSKKAMAYLVDVTVKGYNPELGAPIVVVDADNKEQGDVLEEKLRAQLPEAEIWRQQVGPVIGAHCGPGTLGVIFPSKK